MKISLQLQLAEVNRELGQRRSVYPRLVAQLAVRIITIINAAAEKESRHVDATISEATTVPGAL